VSVCVCACVVYAVDYITIMTAAAAARKWAYLATMYMCVCVLPLLVNGAACQVGRYSASGQTPCTKCPVGTFNPTLGGVTVTACIDCEPNTYNDLLGVSVCANCSVGEFSQQGATSCSPPSLSGTATGSGGASGFSNGTGGNPLPSKKDTSFFDDTTNVVALGGSLSGGVLILLFCWCYRRRENLKMDKTKSKLRTSVGTRRAKRGSTGTPTTAQLSPMEVRLGEQITKSMSTTSEQPATTQPDTQPANHTAENQT